MTKCESTISHHLTVYHSFPEAAKAAAKWTGLGLLATGISRLADANPNTSAMIALAPALMSVALPASNLLIRKVNQISKQSSEQLGFKYAFRFPVAPTTITSAVLVSALGLKSFMDHQTIQNYNYYLTKYPDIDFPQFPPFFAVVLPAAAIGGVMPLCMEKIMEISNQSFPDLKKHISEFGSVTLKTLQNAFLVKN